MFSYFSFFLGMFFQVKAQGVGVGEDFGAFRTPDTDVLLHDFSRGCAGSSVNKTFWDSKDTCGWHLFYASALLQPFV